MYFVKNWRPTNYKLPRKDFPCRDLNPVARVKAEYPNQLDYTGYHEFGAK